MALINKYPPAIDGPTLSLIRGEYDEDGLTDILINGKIYRHDKYGLTTGYKNCLLLYDSAGYLEEVGILLKEKIVEYKFCYSYFK
jgi:hypothetical protein